MQTANFFFISLYNIVSVLFSFRQAFDRNMYLICIIFCYLYVLRPSSIPIVAINLHVFHTSKRLGKLWLYDRKSSCILILWIFFQKYEYDKNDKLIIFKISLVSTCHFIIFKFYDQVKNGGRLELISLINYFKYS